MMPETLCKTGPTWLWRFIPVLSQETKKTKKTWLCMEVEINVENLNILKTVNWKSPRDVWCLWFMLQVIHKCWRETNERSYQIVWWIHNGIRIRWGLFVNCGQIFAIYSVVFLSLINFTKALEILFFMADGNSEIDLLAIWLKCTQHQIRYCNL